MLERVEKALEDIQPVLQSIGSKATVLDMKEGVVHVRLDHESRVHAAVAFRVREFVERELGTGVPEVIEVTFEEHQAPEPQPRAPAAPPTELRYNLIEPPDDTDAFVITFGQTIGPIESKVYESELDATDNPLVKALFAVEGVAKVLVKDQMIVVSRGGGEWGPILTGVREAIRTLTEKKKASEGSVDEQAIWENVWTVLDQQINPSIAAHGGTIQLVEVRGSEIYLFMGGGCQGCGMASVTLSQGVAQAIRDAVPEVTAIHDSTDHGAGENPYFG